MFQVFMLLSLCVSGLSSSPKELPTWQGEIHHSAENDTSYPINASLIISQSHGHKSILREALIMKGRRPAASHHASSIVEVSPGGVFLGAWFGGSFEGEKDVAIFIARYSAQHGWQAPVKVVAPVAAPTWNPVLFKLQNGQVLLFYKVGPSPTNWRGFLKRSSDNGVSWGGPELLPSDIFGPAKNKPLQLQDGTLLCPSSVEKPGKGKEWSCWIEESKDNGHTWQKHGPVELAGKIIQPSLFLDSQSNVHMVMRSRQQFMATSASDFKGHHWSVPRLTAVPCPNSAIDVVRLQDGRLLLVYNHSFKHGVAGRGVLAIAISTDDGQTWNKVLTLENSGGRLYEYSYPAVIQALNGNVHITFTWRRHNIKHLIVDPNQL